MLSPLAGLDPTPRWGQCRARRLLAVVSCSALRCRDIDTCEDAKAREHASGECDAILCDETDTCHSLP